MSWNCVFMVSLASIYAEMEMGLMFKSTVHNLSGNLTTAVSKAHFLVISP